MTSYNGKAINVTRPIVAQVTYKKINLLKFAKTAFISNDNWSFGHKLLLISQKKTQKSKSAMIVDIDPSFLMRLSENDIIQVLPNGRINVLWEKKLNPYDITLFITNQCNAKCIMCPQPPKKDKYPLLDTNLFILKNLTNEPIKKIGITGGEPTTKPNDLIKILKQAYQSFPTSKIDLLTNAKKLSDFSLAKEISIANPNIIYCVSFPSDNMEDFNNIMGGDFYKTTMQSIQNLAILRQNIELRIVISKKNYSRLLQISEFIYRNFPFVQHIAFMGMEVIGYAYENLQELDISPREYNVHLLDAIRFLSRCHMNASIYNIPFCLIDKRLWKFICNSISAWKQNYVNECNLCIKKDNCPGLFSTSKVQKYSLSPIMS